MTLFRLSVGIGPAVILGLFAPALIGVDRLAFRDVSHFYTPLYEYVGARSSQAWLPGWNPLDQTGMPLLGETTTAFFYPVRYLIYSLPLSAELAMTWYVVAHFVLASVTATVSARWAGASDRSAAVAGIVYPLSGSLLGLYTNPPFLVSAAWLPLAAGALLGWRPGRRSLRILIAGASMSMMVLGGDPQTALHTMLIAGGVWLVHAARDKPSAWPGFVTLAAAAAVAAVLSAPQLAASLSWSRHSERLDSRESLQWWQPPRTGSQRDRAYHFSLPPWRVAELATPAPWGSLLPRYRRVSTLIPGDGRLWTFSIYPGLVASLALICRLSRWRRDRIDRWSAIAVISLLLALGHFGLVWLLQNVTGRLSHFDSAIGGVYWLLYQVVPGYDVFRYPAKWMPMFSFAAAITTAQWLDGPVWKPDATKRWVYATLLGVVAVAAVAVVVLRVHPALIQPAEASLPVDRFWGPLDVEGGLREIQLSLIHSIAVLMVFGGLVFRRPICQAIAREAAPIFSMRRRNWRLAMKRLRQRRAGRTAASSTDAESRNGTAFVTRCRFNDSVVARWGVIFLVAVDLAVAGSGWLKTVEIQREQSLVNQLEVEGLASQADRRADVSRWLRTQSGGGWPSDWQDAGSDHRLMEVEASQRVAWMGRWHLSDRHAVLNNMTSIQSREMSLLWQAARHVQQAMSAEERGAFWRSLQRWLAVGGASHTTDRTVQIKKGGRRYDLVEHDRQDHSESPSGIRFHTQWRPTGDNAQTLEAWTRLLNEVRRRGESTVPWVTTDEPIDANLDAMATLGQRLELPADAPSQAKPRVGGESVTTRRGTGNRRRENRGDENPHEEDDRAALRVTSRSADRVELTVSTPTNGLLSRRVYQDGHWIARIKRSGSGHWQRARVHSVDFLAQGILVPPGRWAIQFVYQPVWLKPTVAFGLCGWAGWFGWLGWIAVSGGTGFRRRARPV